MELEDVPPAHAFLKARPEIDPARIGLLGLSLGGMVAALSVKNLEFKSLALWAPAAPSVWLSQFPNVPLDAQAVMAAFMVAKKAGRLPPGIDMLQSQSLPEGVKGQGYPLASEHLLSTQLHRPTSSSAQKPPSTPTMRLLTVKYGWVNNAVSRSPSNKKQKSFVRLEYGALPKA